MVGRRKLKSGRMERWNLRIKHYSQLTAVIIIDRNSKKHPQTKVNQKELPKKKKYFR